MPKTAKGGSTPQTGRLYKPIMPSEGLTLKKTGSQLPLA